MTTIRYLTRHAGPCLLIGIFTGLFLLAIGTAACEATRKKPANCPYLSMDIPLPADAVLMRDDRNDTVRLLKGKNLSGTLEKTVTDPPFREIRSSGSAPEIALAFIRAYHRLFRLDSPAVELETVSVNKDDLGLTHIKFRQVFNGIPVWASELVVHLDRERHIYYIQGRYHPTPALAETRTRLSEADAERIVAARMGRSAAGCPGCRVEKVIYPLPGAPPALAYRVAATAGTVVVHAETGAILENLPAVQTGRIPRK